MIRLYVHPLTTLPSVSLTGDTQEDGRGGNGLGVKPNHDHKQAWPSINNSSLSGGGGGGREGVSYLYTRRFRSAQSREKASLHACDVYAKYIVVPAVTAESAEGHYRMSSAGPHSTIERRCGQL
jgi:hypothetical protein